MDDWAAWLIAAIVLVAVEVATGTVLVPIFFAIGALAAALVALGTDAVLVEGLVGIGVSVASLFALRGTLLHRLQPRASLPTGGKAMLGKAGVVVERIDNDANTGQVRIGGEIWTARSFDEERTFEIGARVDVIELEGVTALVL